VKGRLLVIGAKGYVGSALMSLLPGMGLDVTGTSRRPGTDELIANGSDLDRLLAREHFDQIVLTAQLTGRLLGVGENLIHLSVDGQVEGTVTLR
jgi:nucleoside-diphosphate-sugar epimerase